MTAAKAFAFIRRDFLTQSSYRFDFLLRLVRILASLTIFYYVSKTIGTAATPYLQRYDSDYFHFVLLGVAFYPFIRLSLSSLSDSLQRYQQNGTLEIMFVSPTPILRALYLSTLWNFGWAMIQMLSYLLMATLFFQAALNWSNLALALVILLLSVAANTGLGLVSVSFLLVTKRPSPLIYAMSLATNLLAGLYFPVEVLPGWLRSLSYVLPATYSFEALRQVLLQESSLETITMHLFVLSLFSLILTPIGYLAFRIAVRQAKIEGSLSQF